MIGKHIKGEGKMQFTRIIGEKTEVLFPLKEVQLNANIH